MFCKETEFKDSPIGKIPKDWDITNFGESFSFEKGKKPHTLKEEQSKGFLPYLSTQYLRQNGFHNFALESKDVITVSNDDLILLWDGSNAGEFFLGKKGILSSTMVKIKQEKKEKFKTLFLFYFLKTREKYIQGQTKGTGIPHVDGNVLDRLAVPIPKPSEQEKIIEVLGVVDSALDLADRVIGKTERLRKGLMQQLLTQGTEQSESDGNLPNWRRLSLGDICIVSSGQVDPEIEPFNSLLHVGPENIEKETGCLNGMKTARELNLISGKYVFDEKSILYSKIRPNLMKVALPNFQGICSADIYPIKPKDDLDRTFLFYLLLSNKFTRFAVSKSSRTGIPKINRPELLSYQFLLPPITEQRKIASILSTVTRKFELERKEREVIVRMKQGLMDLLLTGKVRIKVD